MKKNVARLALTVALLLGGVNPKFCVNPIKGANRAKFICGGSGLIRLPSCQQHNA